MTAMTNDTSRVGPRLGSGLIFALSSSAAFGLSGPLAKGLIEAGWTPGSAVTARLLIISALTANSTQILRLQPPGVILQRQQKPRPLTRKCQRGRKLCHD